VFNGWSSSYQWPVKQMVGGFFRHRQTYRDVDIIWQTSLPRPEAASLEKQTPPTVLLLVQAFQGQYDFFLPDVVSGFPFLLIITRL
jgi:hypothetical protein